MNKEEFFKAIENVPKTDSINPISAYNSINVEDLANAVDRFKKVPTYDELLKENKKYKEVIDKAIKCIDYNTKYRNGSDIYQFVDIESEILEPLKFILELDEENGNAYLKKFNDWLKEAE